MQNVEPTQSTPKWPKLRKVVLDICFRFWYNKDNQIRERRRVATATCYLIYQKKKLLTSYLKYGILINVKRRYQKETRLDGRGQGRKLLTNYPKCAILIPEKRVTVVHATPATRHPCPNKRQCRSMTHGEPCKFNIG